jgi:hypothetical protein
MLLASLMIAFFPRPCVSVTFSNLIGYAWNCRNCYEYILKAVHQTQLGADMAVKKILRDCYMH